MSGSKYHEADDWSASHIQGKMTMTHATQEVTIDFAAFVDPQFHARPDIDGSLLQLDPIEDAVFDLVSAVDDGKSDFEWDALAALALDPRFAKRMYLMCRAKAEEARRIGDSHGR